MIHQVLIGAGQTNGNIQTNLFGFYKVKLISIYFADNIDNGDEVAIIQSNIFNDIFNARLYVGCQSVNTINLEFVSNIQNNITFTVLNAGDSNPLAQNNGAIIITLDITPVN